MFGEYTNPVNKGLEGLTWDGNKQNLFAAKEMKDVINLSILESYSYLLEKSR